MAHTHAHTQNHITYHAMHKSCIAQLPKLQEVTVSSSVDTKQHV